MAEAPVRVLGLVASPSATSRTQVLVERILSAASDAGAACDLVGLAGLVIDVADGRRAEEYTGDTARVLAALDAADAVVFGMPVYRAEMPGALKNLLDIVPRGRWDGAAQPLRARPVAIAATGATDHHFLALDGLSGMLRGFFAAWVVPPGVYASQASFAEGALVDERVMAAADRTGAALVGLARVMPQAPALRLVEPQV